MLFNEILSLSLEGYFEYLISGYLSYKKDFLYNTVFGETLSIIVAYSCLSLALIFLPGTLLYLIYGSFEPDDTLSVLYEGIKTNRKLTLAYYLVYIFRRGIFCLIAFNFNDNPVY